MNTNPKAKRILFYGDSITWGRIPNTLERYPSNVRFTGVLQEKLGSAFEVIEEGCRGRMAKGENPYFPERNGFIHFPVILASHLPVDILFIFLGTNDTNNKSNKTAELITEDLESYIPLIKDICKRIGFQPPTHIVYIAPPHINEFAFEGVHMFTGATEKSKKLPALLEKMTKKCGTLFVDASSVVSPSQEDGIHLNTKEHAKLGRALANFIRSLT